MGFQFQRRVEFRDTDAAGIVHFSAFFPMMESAEHAMLRSLGMTVIGHRVDDGAPISWPRVSAGCDYLSPARFEETLDIRVTVGKIGKSSVRYDFKIEGPRGPVATGQLTAVCCRMTESGLSKTDIPGEIRDLLGQMQ